MDDVLDHGSSALAATAVLQLVGFVHGIVSGVSGVAPTANKAWVATAGKVSSWIGTLGRRCHHIGVPWRGHEQKRLVSAALSELRRQVRSAAMWACVDPKCAVVSVGHALRLLFRLGAKVDFALASTLNRRDAESNQVILIDAEKLF